MPDNVVAYTLVKHPPGPPSQVKRDLAKQAGVYFVAEFTGEFRILVAREYASLEELQAANDALWVAGVRSEDLRLVASSRIRAPKRGSPDYCAMIRAHTTSRPKEVLDALDDAFESRAGSDPDFSYGAAVVTGRYSLLIDLGAASLEELDRTILEELLEVPGVGRTSTSTAYLPGNEIRPGSSTAS